MRNPPVSTTQHPPVDTTQHPPVDTTDQSEAGAVGREEHWEDVGAIGPIVCFKIAEKWEFVLPYEQCRTLQVSLDAPQILVIL